MVLIGFAIVFSKFLPAILIGNFKRTRLLSAMAALLALLLKISSLLFYLFHEIID